MAREPYMALLMAQYGSPKIFNYQKLENFTVNTIKIEHLFAFFWSDMALQEGTFYMICLFQNFGRKIG